MLLDYQSDWVNESAQIAVWEKSRRIGASWCDAAASVLASSRHNGMDTLYIGYTEEMTRGYIEDCAKWTTVFSEGQDILTGRTNEKPDIKAFRIDYPSGNKILALSSNPRNLRGKQGRIVIDEAAFHDDFEGLLKAGTSMLIWGGQLRILSTHNGENSAFDRMVKQSKVTGKASVHTTTFDDAVEAGLYRKVCEMQGIEWTPQREAAWVIDIRERHGRHAAEELDVVPGEGRGDLFKREWFEVVDRVPFDGKEIRQWDLAASEPTPQNPDPDYTVGVKMKQCSDAFYVTDVRRTRSLPMRVEQLVLSTASHDGLNTEISLYQDPGAAGKAEVERYITMLSGFNVHGHSTTRDKRSRAEGLSAQAEGGRVKILRGPWNEDFIQEMCDFDGTGRGHDDQVDAASGAFNRLALPKETFVIPIF